MIRRTVGAALWLVLTATSGVAIGRIIGLERSIGRFYALVTLLPWLLLPAWAVLAVGVATRRRAAAVVALVLVGLHVAWVVPDLRGEGRRRDPRPDDLVLVTVNAQRGNGDAGALGARLAAVRADAVVVTELTPEIAAALDLALPSSTYPGRALHPEDGFFGAGIYTKAELSDRSLVLVDGRPTPMVRFEHGGRPLTLVAVHTIQPLADLLGLQRGLDDLAALRDDAPADGFVLAGDFNATRQHRPFRRLLERTGLRDAHAAAGRGLARTWPAGTRVPPFALLDHVVVSDDIVVVDVRELDAPGSDHRAVIARLGV